MVIYNNNINQTCQPQPMSSCGIRRVIQLQYAQRIKSIQLYNADNQEITYCSKYSWSSDGCIWSPYCDHKNLMEYVRLASTDYYIRILINDSLGAVLLDGVPTNCYNMALDSTNIFLQEFCSEPNLFQPYNGLDCAILLQQQLADSVICMFGIPIYYFSVMPDKKTADFTFKEYVLHNIESVKQLKLMIPGGELPSSNPQMTEFDFDWQTDWETEISKTQFARAFGDKAFPHANDIIYIPMMKRLWEVNAAYDEKNEGLMYHATTWKLQLVKYNESTNTSGSELDGLVDTLALNQYDSIFGCLERNEQERLSGTAQVSFPNHAADNLYNIFLQDSTRAQISQQGVKITKTDLYHKNNQVVRNMYRFTEPDSMVVYQNKICGDEGTISFIIDTNMDTMVEHPEHPLIQAGNIEIGASCTNNNIYIIFNGSKVNIERNKTYMILCRWSNELVVTSLDVFEHKGRPGVPKYQMRPELYMFDFLNPVGSERAAFNPDYNIKCKQLCTLSGYPYGITNFKLYNRYLDDKTAIKECTKYTSTSDKIIINDLARPLDNGPGYVVK